MSDQGAPTKTISDFEAKLAEADRTVASFERDDRGLVHRAQGFLRSYPTSIPALVLILSVIAFGIVAPRFLGIGAMSTILQQVTVTGIVAIAQTLVILTAGIDLSVGAILVVGALIMGNLGVNLGWPVGIAILVGLFFTGLMGWINGMLVAFVKLPPFIVTLGHAQRLYFAEAMVFTFGIDPQHRHRGQGPGAVVVWRGAEAVRLQVDLWHYLADRAGGDHLVCAEPHRLGAACPCHRR